MLDKVGEGRSLKVLREWWYGEGDLGEGLKALKASLDKRFGVWWFVGLGFAVLVGVGYLLGDESKDQENPQPPEPKTNVAQEWSPNDRVLRRTVDGIARLSLEYGIVFDETDKDTLNSYMAGRPAEEEEEWGAWWASWTMSDQDYADALKEEILDDGESPQAILESLHDRIERLQE